MKHSKRYTSQAYSSTADRYSELKNQAQEITEEYLHLKDCKEKLQIFLVSHSLKNQEFVKQYTTLYKSYMILVAFILTLIGNYFYIYFESNLKRQSVNQELKQVNKVWINKDFIENQAFENLLQNIYLILPLKGKFSIVFFQLMLLTSIQIIYETINQLRHRFSSKKIKNHENQKRLKDKTISTEKHKSTQIQKQKHQKVYHSQQIHRLALKSFKSEQKINSQSVSCLLRQCSKLADLLQTLPEFKYIGQRQNQPQKQTSDVETKFLYIFSLVCIEPILWEGIIIRKWTTKMIHFMFILSCIVEFALWNIINITLHAEKIILLGDHQIIQFSPNYQITLGKL